jgi:hypothetical protein
MEDKLNEIIHGLKLNAFSNIEMDFIEQHILKDINNNNEFYNTIKNIKMLITEIKILRFLETACPYTKDMLIK